MTDADSPPSYESVVGILEARIGNHVTPEKVLDVVSSLSATEAKVLADTEVDPHDMMSQIDKKKFDEGVRAYLGSTAAQDRLRYTAEEAAKACRLINTMFNNLSAKLGEVDGKNKGTKKFIPDFKVLHQKYVDILQASGTLAARMGGYARRFENKILKITFDKRIPFDTKMAKLQEYISDAKGFEDEAKAMQKSFLELQTDFAAFTGSFGSWADGEDKKIDGTIEELRKKIDDLEKEIDSIKGKMILWGSVGTFGTLGVTTALVACLGPVGLLAGLIGAGVTIGFMVHWNNEITWRRDRQDGYKKEKKDLETEKDSIVATRAQLVELGNNSFDVFKKQLANLTLIWTYAMNDAACIQDELAEIKKDGKELNDEIYREIYLLPHIASASALYGVMAGYLEKYADGIHRTD